MRSNEGDQIRVLDHGSVKFIEAWGADYRIIEAARMSTDKGFVDWEHDAKLLSFLYRNKHMTPFEIGGMVLEIKAPIFVFREWHRHRTQSYNEMSARYIPLPNENYLPDAENAVARSEKAAAATNRQAAGTGKILTLAVALTDLVNLLNTYDQCQAQYDQMLDHGWPKELARLPVPVARYSRMRASANLRNWLQFMELRMAAGAQQEIRLFANAVAKFVELQFPKTFALFSENSK